MATEFEGVEPRPDVVASSLEDQLRTIVRSSEYLMTALRAARTLALPDWYLAAGAVRNLVWDALFANSLERGAVPDTSDLDVVYFDQHVSIGQDEILQCRLRELLPLRWEVVNQANVHRWHQVEPFRSTEDAIAAWPETATCVGVRLEQDDALSLCHPLGLADLFSGVVRYNPALVSRIVFDERVVAKRFLARWPSLRLA